MLAAALVALSISACQPTEDNNHDAISSDGKNWSCQAQNTPFAYSVCRIDAKALTDTRYSLQLFWQQSDSNADNNQPLLTFDALLAALPSNKTLNFELRALNIKEGGGNFHLLPNGVMWWDKSGKVKITESKMLDNQLKSGNAQPWYATQSGPMLVIDNEIHPQFKPNSTSLKLRNGAGVCSDGSIQFVNSEAPVSFYQFAALFKDELSCPNALFLDGGIASALYAPSIDKHDKKEMGVMIGLIETKN